MTWRLLVLGYALVLLPTAASAQNFSFGFFALNGPSVSLIGSGSADPSGVSSPFLLTTARGLMTRSGTGVFHIVGLVEPGEPGGGDNLVYTSGPSFVSGLGITFSLDNGGGRVNVSFQNGSHIVTHLDALNSQPTMVKGRVTQAAAVPSPLAGAGLIPILGLAGAWFLRRRNRDAPAAACP
jgi:hypothetical protein